MLWFSVAFFGVRGLVTFHLMFVHKTFICLAHLSQRLIGELIVYPFTVVVVVFVGYFQTSSPPKPLGQSKPNFMWSLLEKGEPKFA